MVASSPPSSKPNHTTIPSPPPDFDCSSVAPLAPTAMNAEKTYDDFDDVKFTLDSEELDED